MRLLRQFWDWLRSWFPPKPRRWRAVRVEDLPDSLAPFSVYLVGEGPYVWQVALMCPCGCKATLCLPVVPGSKPRWDVTEHADGVVTLSPSVRRRVGCRSHFFLRKGLIRWAT